jgi:hypothetical protein
MEMDRSGAIQNLLELLASYQEGPGVFNQYRDNDLRFDRPNGARIRRENLKRYLEAFSGASYLLVGEAAGYAGCRFSGIPFTGEVQIVGENCLPWARTLGFEQSSRDALWRERSGQIVWEAFDGRLDCVLWNTFPWHPFDRKPLSNRKPTRQELDHATTVLRAALDLFPHAEVRAIGRVSEAELKSAGVEAGYIRHPSHGGKPRFVAGIQSLTQHAARPGKI